MRDLESKEQEAVINWCKSEQGNYTELSLIFAIPNGGNRHIATAVRLKKEGVRAGVADLFLPVSRHGKHGLFIEMKAGKNKASTAQLEFKVGVVEQGYMWELCVGRDAAVRALKYYLGGG